MLLSQYCDIIEYLNIIHAQLTPNAQADYNIFSINEIQFFLSSFPYVIKRGRLNVNVEPFARHTIQAMSFGYQ